MHKYKTSNGKRFGRNKGGHTGSGKAKKIALGVGAALLAGGIAIGSYVALINDKKDLEVKVEELEQAIDVRDYEKMYNEGKMQGIEAEAIKELEKYSDTVSDLATRERIEELQRKLYEDYMTTSLAKMYEKGYIHKNDISHEDNEQVVRDTNVATGEYVEREREDMDISAICISQLDENENLVTVETLNTGRQSNVKNDFESTEQLLTSEVANTLNWLDDYTIAVDKAGDVYAVKTENKEGSLTVSAYKATAIDGKYTLVHYENNVMKDTIEYSASDAFTFDKALQAATSAQNNFVNGTSITKE